MDAGCTTKAQFPAGRDILYERVMFVVGEPALVARIPLPAFGL